MQRELPVWRSLMYVPVNVEKYVDKAHTRGADCIQLDLEDSVPVSEKEHARTLVGKAAARVRRAGADEALAAVLKVLPGANPNPAFRAALNRLAP